jgi:hypothetical protein
MCHNDVPMVSLHCPYGVPTVSLCSRSKASYDQSPMSIAWRTMPYAHRPMPYAQPLCPAPYVLPPTPYALCTTTYILRSTHYVLSHHPYFIHPTPNARAQFPKSNAIHMSSHIYCSICHTNNTMHVLRSTLDMWNRDTYATTKSIRTKSNSVLFMECTCYNIYVCLNIACGEL